MFIVASPFRYAEGIEHLCPYSELKFKDKVRHVFSLPVCSVTPCTKENAPNGRLLRANANGSLLAKVEVAGATDYESLSVKETGGHCTQLTTFSQTVKFVLGLRTYGAGGDDYIGWSTDDGVVLRGIPLNRFVYLPFYGTKIYTAAGYPDSKYILILLGFF